MNSANPSIRRLPLGITLFWLCLVFSLNAQAIDYLGDGSTPFPKSIQISDIDSDKNILVIEPFKRDDKYHIRLIPESNLYNFGSNEGILISLDDTGNTISAMQAETNQLQTRIGTTGENSFYIINRSNTDSYINLGIYSFEDSGNPIFERSITNLYETHPSVFEIDRRAFSVTNFVNDKINAWEIDANGETAWNAQFSSEDFEIHNTNTQFGSLFSRIVKSSNSSYLIVRKSVSTFEPPITFSTQLSAMVVKLSYAGEVLWTKKTEMGYANPNIVVLPNDNIMLFRPLVDSDNESTEPESTATQLDPNGNLNWSIRVPGAASISTIGTVSDTTILLVNPSPISSANVSTLLAIDPSGIVLSQFSIEYGAKHSSGFYLGTNRIWVALNTYEHTDITENIESKSLLGWIDINLNQSSWVEYARETRFMGLSIDPESNQVLFAATQKYDNRKIDLALLDENLQSETDCNLFSPFEPMISHDLFEVVSSNETLETANVSSVPYSFETSEASNTIANLDVTDIELCKSLELAGYPEVNDLSIHIDQDGALISFPSEKAQAYSIEQNENLLTENWSEVLEVSGDGYQVNETLPIPPDDETFYRITPLAD